MKLDFADLSENTLNRINQKLSELVIEPVIANDASLQFGNLEEACQYVVENGGKRIRPLLVFLAALAIEETTHAEKLDFPACAVELLHTYSLVHDDLPAMDDDDLRRGKPSCHKAYNEATAVLVGDGLQARAFELLTLAPDLTAEQRIDMVAVLAEAAGTAGMVGGQYMDISVTGSEISISELETMHSLKTGALIRAALKLGGIAASATPSELHALESYGTYIGLAFQVVDDILDVEGDAATLGKTQGKDDAANKPTYVKLLGISGAKDKAEELLEDALKTLNGFSEKADPLRDLARYIVRRDH